MEDNFIDLYWPIEMMLFAIEEMEKANHRLFFQELLSCTRELIIIYNTIEEKYYRKSRFLPLSLSNPSPSKVRVAYNEADFEYINAQLHGTNIAIDVQLYLIEDHAELHNEIVKVMDKIHSLADDYNLAIRYSGAYKKIIVLEKEIKYKTPINIMTSTFRNILKYQKEVDEYGIHDGYYQAGQRYIPISPTRHTHARIDEQGRGLRAMRENKRYSPEGKFIKRERRVGK